MKEKLPDVLSSAARCDIAGRFEDSLFDIMDAKQGELKTAFALHLAPSLKASGRGEAFDGAATELSDTDVEALCTWDVKDLYQISWHEFMCSMEQANTDLAFMKARRGLVHGVSPGKFMGTIVFRMCRHPIVHFSKPLLSVKGFEFVKEIALIQAAFDYLEIDADRPWLQSKLKNGARVDRPNGRQRFIEDIRQELIWMLKMRHYNQESLAMVFDTLCILDELMEEHAGCMKNPPNGGRVIKPWDARIHGRAVQRPQLPYGHKRP